MKTRAMTIKAKTRDSLSCPRPVKRTAARARVAECLASAGEEVASALRALPDWPQLEEVLAGIADQSPFLWGLARRDPARLLRLRRLAPETALEETLRRLAACHADDCTEAQAMSLLRKAKQETALIVALADLAGEFDVVAATKALSRAADRFVATALRVALRLSGDRLALADAGEPEANCGLVVLALGKHGAMELNYSSDVDLVVFYELRSPVLGAGPGVKANSLRIVQHLVKLLQERTGDGYVLRVDLRLRPDPGSTAAAVSLDAARHYYETLGQNWERAAMIKARPVAGDLALGFDFLGEMAAFIWRKYFDYATIADIHAMKRQIHAAKGHAEIAVAGHDVKLGRGGIREIEFFVQTQQLIFGGRRTALRGSRTLDMLRQLCADDWITAQAADDLSDAYRYLRAVEHRLQMQNDHQTQRLPEDDAALKNFARFCGYAGLGGFSRDLLRHFHAVEKHYARLFEHAPGLDSRAGNLVFTGSTDDPETLETLRDMGFRDPALAAETVRGWHFGRRPAVRSARAREVLTELVPGLLEAFSKSGDADSCMAGFDAALARMPAAAELFALLKSHGPMLEFFADILGGAPRLAQVIVQSPHVLDVAIDRGVAAAPMDVADFSHRLALFHEGDQGLEAFLDAARIFAGEENFMIGLRLFAGLIEPEQAAHAYTALAEAMARACLARVQADFSVEHGRVPGGRCVVLGLGKLGSRELTATSDLDLVLLYDFDPERPESDGRRPLHAAVYYARLTQRLIAALSAPTRRGKLFEVDMRLRPSGNKGPLATQLGVVSRLSGVRGRNLGTYGADAGASDRRRRQPRRRGLAIDRRNLVPPARPGEARQGRARHAQPDRQGEGRGRALEPQAGGGRPARRGVFGAIPGPRPWRRGARPARDRDGGDSRRRRRGEAARRGNGGNPAQGARALRQCDAMAAAGAGRGRRPAPGRRRRQTPHRDRDRTARFRLSRARTGLHAQGNPAHFQPCPVA